MLILLSRWKTHGYSTSSAEKSSFFPHTACAIHSLDAHLRKSLVELFYVSLV